MSSHSILKIRSPPKIPNGHIVALDRHLSKSSAFGMKQSESLEFHYVNFKNKNNNKEQLNNGKYYGNVF